MTAPKPQQARTQRIKVVPPLDSCKMPHLACCMCGKETRSSGRRMVRLVGGGNAVLHPDDEALYKDDGGDCGGHYVGPDCARNLGLEWSRP